MLSRKSLISITLQGKNIFLFSEYEPEKNLTIKILNIKDNESYIGQVCALDLRTQAARIRLTFKDYMDHAMRALFQSDQEDFNYIYSFEEIKDFIHFKWKSIDQDETVINLGFVAVKKQDYVTAFKESLLSLASEIQGLNSTVRRLNSVVEDCKNQTANAFNLLSQAIDAKDSLEEEMFAKFSLVLNEKKKLIQMRKNRKLFMANRMDALTRPLKNVISESSEEDEDEEEDEILDLNRPGPSTSVKRNALFDDDDDECVVPLKPSKMRNRNNANKRKPNSPEHVSDVTNNSRPEMMFDDDSDDLLSNL